MPESNKNLREINTLGKWTQERLVDRAACPPLSLFDIRLIGLSDAGPGFRFERPQPSLSQALVCLEGNGSVWVNGEWRACGPGMAYITGPGAYHAYAAGNFMPRPACMDDPARRRPGLAEIDRAAGKSQANSELGTQRDNPALQRWRLCWIMYDVGHLRVSAASEGPILIEVEPWALAHCIEELHREVTGQADSAMMRLWTELTHLCAQRMMGPPRTDHRLSRMWDRVRQDPGYAWTVHEMADTAGVSGEHLRRLCKVQMGYSPMHQVARLRMRHAAALLASDSYTIETIARIVGYENPFAFATAFKRCMGMPPSEYRGRLLMK